MARPKIYTDDERKEKKKEANEKEENKLRRRFNALKYYENKKLNEYKIKNDNINGFEYKYLNMTFENYKQSL